MNYKISTRSKSDYLHCLEIIDNLRLIRKQATGDDWNCKFEIVFSADNIPNLIMQKVKRLSIQLQSA